MKNEVLYIFKKPWAWELFFWPSSYVPLFQVSLKKIFSWT
jgi:hypothetical protein